MTAADTDGDGSVGLDEFKNTGGMGATDTSTAALTVRTSTAAQRSPQS